MIILIKDYIWYCKYYKVFTGYKIHKILNKS